MHYGWYRPSECHPKIFNSIIYQFGQNFKNQLSPFWLYLLKNELYFCNGDKMAKNFILMQQLLTLFIHILAKWHLFAHSAMQCKSSYTNKKFSIHMAPLYKPSSFHHSLSFPFWAIIKAWCSSETMNPAQVPQTGPTGQNVSAPRRGRGVLQQQQPGMRVPMCGSCDTQIRWCLWQLTAGIGLQPVFFHFHSYTSYLACSNPVAD